MGDMVCHHTGERKGQGFTKQRGDQRCDKLLGKSLRVRGCGRCRKVKCRAVALSSEGGWWSRGRSGWKQGKEPHITWSNSRGLQRWSEAYTIATVVAADDT